MGLGLGLGFRLGLVRYYGQSKFSVNTVVRVRIRGRVWVSMQHGPKKMRDVLHFAGFHLPFTTSDQHLEEPERGGCPLGQMC